MVLGLLGWHYLDLQAQEAQIRTEERTRQTEESQKSQARYQHLLRLRDDALFQGVRSLLFPGTDSPFPGLSKYVSQATAYYEKKGWSARIAATHRSDFLGEVQAFGADQEFHDVHAETITDVQLGYTFQSGSRFENLTILFQAQNMFNEPYREFYGTAAQPNLPARSVMQVAGLVVPGWLVEIEVIAVR